MSPSSSLINGSSNARQAPEPSSLDTFIAEVRDLARSLDPALAAILGDETPVEASRPWTGDRLRGLSLCLNMLRYARAEVRRGERNEALDRAIEHVTDEIADMSAYREGGRA